MTTDDNDTTWGVTGAVGPASSKEKNEDRGVTGAVGPASSKEKKKDRGVIEPLHSGLDDLALVYRAPHICLEACLRAASSWIPALIGYVPAVIALSQERKRQPGLEATKSVCSHAGL